MPITNESLNTLIAPTSKRVVLKKGKLCTGSIRYEYDGENTVPITNIYLSRTFANPMPDEVTVIIEG